MKTFILVPLGVILAVAGSSCSSTYAPGYQAAGYSPRDAYYRGHVDGSGDRLHGKAYDPHINEDRTLPGAFRKDYVWGYNDGFRKPAGYGGGK
ncbi:hypothetical protein OKA04_11100 [Luteolibacter flavescens]|uniref:Lipoprotein n=1 Tax=Luteolibacter flavescens TaxID=1859460 RepID=A0ABT3FPA6_9BACT|nr:hypothetical protein [Luteolibacter flavescens]MCW1885277.1 hypothetical protein [Luteolibacter flavescens]